MTRLEILINYYTCVTIHHGSTMYIQYIYYDTGRTKFLQFTSTSTSNVEESTSSLDCVCEASESTVTKADFSMRSFLPDPRLDGDYSSDSEEPFEIYMDDHAVNQPVEPQAHVSHEGPSQSERSQEEVQIEEEDNNWLSSDSDDEEKGATLEEVFEIEPALEKTREQPPDLDVGAEVVDIEFHPSAQLLAVATLDSEVVCYKYTKESTEEVHSSEHHTSCLRCVKFSKDGSSMFTASKDESVAVLDTATWKVLKHIKNAHDYPVYSLCVVNENLLASGDDNGNIKLWDLRKQNSIHKFECSEETVNDMVVDDSGRTLVAALNDGSIAAYNTSQRKLIVQSEYQDEALSCLAIVRNGTRLAVGGEKGALYLFKWGEFALHHDKVAEQRAKLNCMVPVGDGRIVTGSDDGYIRAVNLYPHNYAGVIGRHQKYGIENISVSCDQRFLASCSLDDTVQFWDLQHLYNTQKRKKSCLARDLKNNLDSARERNPAQFFSDMAEEVPSDEEYMGPADKPKNVE